MSLSQITLISKEHVDTKTPFSDLTPNERRIYNLLRSIQAGRTERQIHSRFPDMAQCGNRLRKLRQKGWAHSVKLTRDEEQLWYAIEPEEDHKK